MACGTPRRLIVTFPNLKPRQEDSVKEQRGPSLQAAYDAAGEPTKALLGFCKSQGIEPSDLRKDEQYVWVTKHVSGLPTPELLESILPRIILGLNFEKSMRWGASRARFARPIRWILAAYGGKALDFNVEGVHSALISYGHRFYAPDPFEAKAIAQLETELRNRFVEVSSESRKASILEQAKSISSGTPEITDDLLDENTFLTEWPTAILGSFPESYLELPEPVLVTAMAKHERMFPVRDGAGKLTNQFIFIRNSGEDETVRKGCEWVLGARFNDARFFYEQDQKLTLDDFLAKTEGVVFQAQLGSVRQRADRLANLAKRLAPLLKADPQLASKAGLYAKADLATGLVSELSSLQGVIGGQYAERAGFEPEVCDAISRQYMDLSDFIPGARFNEIAVSLQLADNLDKLAGYLGLKLIPTGSSDPFGLRKAVTALVKYGNIFVTEPFSKLIQLAFDEYEAQGHSLDREGAVKELAEIFAGRYLVMWTSSDARRPFEAAIASNMSANIGGSKGRLTANLEAATTPAEVNFRLQCLEQFTEASDLQTIARPINLTNSAKAKGEKIGGLTDVTTTGLNSAEGDALLAVLTASAPEVEEARRTSNPVQLADTLKSLLPTINAFFDRTMVMSDDPTERFHRLSLANAAAEQLLVAGDFTKLEG